MLVEHPRAEQAEAERRPREEAPEGSGLARLRFALLAAGGTTSIVWLGLCGFYIERMVGWNNLTELFPHELGAIFAGVATPLAFLWLFLSFLAQGAERQRQASALAQTLAELTYPTPEAEAKISAITVALRRQSRELQSHAETTLSQVAGITHTLQSELGALKQIGRASCRERV